MNTVAPVDFKGLSTQVSGNHNGDITYYKGENYSFPQVVHLPVTFVPGDHAQLCGQAFTVWGGDHLLFQDLLKM